MNTESNPWFDNEGKCLVDNVPRLISRRQIPSYLLEIYKKKNISNLILRMYCTRWFRAMLLLPIALILSGEKIWVDAGVCLGIVDICLAIAINRARKDIAEFSKYVKQIIIAGGSELSPSTFPQSAMELKKFVHNTLCELALRKLRYEKSVLEEQVWETRLALMGQELLTKGLFESLFKVAETFGVKTEEGYNPYFRNAMRILCPENVRAEAKLSR